MNSVTGKGIGYLKISIRKGINNIYTYPLEVIETRESGYYQTPELDAGNYCLEINSWDGKHTYTCYNIKVFGDTTIRNQNISVSGSLEDNQMRVVLTWGEKPRDLDSHLEYRLLNGESGHVYCDKRDGILNSDGIAELDKDDTDCFGPETIIIYNDKIGDYTFYVKNVSRETSMGGGNAMVKIYFGKQPIPFCTLTIPDKIGQIWTVFKYSSKSGKLTVINELASQVK